MIKQFQYFLDGENLVFRYQDMVKSGRKPTPDVLHVQDIFVWHPKLAVWTLLDLIRATYYTSVAGDEVRRQEAASKISKTQFNFSTGSHTGIGGLVPRVFKKDSQGRKRRIVDIQMTIDIMSVALTVPVDAILLASGDGDFHSLNQEVMRTGKKMFVAAFSSGLGLDPSTVDGFIDLDALFFEPMR